MYLDNSTMSHLNAAEALAQLQNLPKLGTSSAPQEKPNRNRSTGLAIKFPEIVSLNISCFCHRSQYNPYSMNMIKMKN